MFIALSNYSSPVFLQIPPIILPNHAYYYHKWSIVQQIIITPKNKTIKNKFSVHTVKPLLMDTPEMWISTV